MISTVLVVCWLVTACCMIVFDLRMRRLNLGSLACIVIWPAILLIESVMQVLFECHGEDPTDYSDPPYSPTDRLS